MKHYKLEIVFGIPEHDYISTKDLISYIKEDFPDWFASNIMDGDSDRMSLLDVNCESDYDDLNIGDTLG